MQTHSYRTHTHVCSSDRALIAVKRLGACTRKNAIWRAFVRIRAAKESLFFGLHFAKTKNSVFLSELFAMKRPIGQNETPENAKHDRIYLEHDTVSGKALSDRFRC